MNNCPSTVDIKYYSSKYNLSFVNKRDAIEHYIKVGKNRGFFPNEETEKFHNKTINFDQEYYHHKYRPKCDVGKSKKYWLSLPYNISSKQMTSYCDEYGSHSNPKCKCTLEKMCIDRRSKKPQHKNHMNHVREIINNQNNNHKNHDKHKSDDESNESKDDETLVFVEVDDFEGEYIVDNYCIKKNETTQEKKIIMEDITKKNIEYIRIYLDRCSDYAERYLEYLVKAYSYLSEMAKLYGKKDSEKYNSVVTNIGKTLEEADALTRIVNFDGLPFFRKKKTTWIKFPLIAPERISDNNKSYKHYNIQLLKTTLDNIGLDKYSRDLKVLWKKRIMTHSSNPLPPYYCPLGKKPTHNMYDDQSLLKNWDLNHHLEVFEKAIHEVKTEITKLKNHFKTINEIEANIYKLN